MKDALGNRRGQWAGRKFTRAQLLKRDIRSAATRSEKNAAKPTLPKLKCLEEEPDDPALTSQQMDDYSTEVK